MKRFVLTGLTLLFLLVLAACGSVEPEAPATDSAADTLSFSIDPSTQEAKLLAPSVDTDLGVQGKSGRRVLTQKDLAVKNVKFTFEKGNTLKVSAAFKNVSACNLSEFTFTKGSKTRNIISSVEPVVTVKDLGGNGVLSPKEVTKPLTFTVKHKGKPFVYQVKVAALVSCEPQGFDLGITVITQADTVTVGENIVYSVTAVNNGPAAVKDAGFSGDLGFSMTEWLVEDGLLPEGCAYDNSSPGTRLNRILVCNLGTLAAGEKKQVTLTAKALAAGDAEALFVVFPDPFIGDTDGTNDSAFLVMPVTGQSEPTDLIVGLYSLQNGFQVGEPVTYYVIVDRSGGPATGVKLKADFELPVTLISVKPDAPCSVEQVEDAYHLECDLDLSSDVPGNSPTESTVILSAETSKLGSFSAFATVSSNETDSYLDNNSSALNIEVFDNSNGCTDSFGIPDDLLERSLREALNKPEGAITCADMESLTELEIEGYEYAGVEVSDYARSYEGLQYATNLTSLDIAALRFEAGQLEPLSGLENLTELTLFSRSTVTPDLSVLSDLTNLAKFEISTIPAKYPSDYNGSLDLSDLSPFSGLTKLTELRLLDTTVSDLSPLRGLSNLAVLELPHSSSEYSGNISSIKPLASLTKLRELNLSGNSVSDLAPLSGLTNLTRLDLNGNLLRDI